MHKVYEPQVRARPGTAACLCEVVARQRLVLNPVRVARIARHAPWRDNLSWWQLKTLLAFPGKPYRGTSLIRNTPLLGPYSRTIPKVIWWSWGGGLFLMSEVPLYQPRAFPVRYRAKLEHLQDFEEFCLEVKAGIWP